MRRIEFHDREKEIKEIKNIFERAPSLITFIYGPINSGKTELIRYLVKQLPGEYVIFYINLRAKFLAKISGKDVTDKVKILLETRKSQILSIFDDIALKRVDVFKDAVIKEFSVFENEEKVRYKRLSEAKIFLVKKNVLFVDPTRRTIRPQSRLDLLAMREVVKET